MGSGCTVVRTWGDPRARRGVHPQLALDGPLLVLARGARPVETKGRVENKYTTQLAAARAAR
eukprot:195311-Lingulodinium_polyedra.AAC.1